MTTPKEKVVGGYHTATTTTKIHASNVAPGQKKRYTALMRCATLRASPELLGTMLENITKSARSLRDSEAIFSSKFYGFGRDGVNRKAARSTDFEFSTSRPPVALEKAASGFQSQSGAETMTTVNTPTTSTLDAIARQQAIENALSAALFHIRQPHTTTALWAATGRANRALAMLKQACAEAKTTTQGRA